MTNAQSTSWNSGQHKYRHAGHV